MKKIRIRQITMIGIMAAAVYMASAFLQISIPTAIGTTRLHMGNVMCLLSGMLLGAVPGGLAAGIGSMLFDFSNPVYIASAPFTFAFKFVMAWLCGALSTGRHSEKFLMKICSERSRLLVAAAAGAFSYVLLYIGKNFIENRYVLGMPSEAVWLMTAQKGAVSCVNAVAAVIVVVTLGVALRPVLNRCNDGEN